MLQIQEVKMQSVCCFVFNYTVKTKSSNLQNSVRLSADIHYGKKIHLDVNFWSEVYTNDATITKRFQICNKKGLTVKPCNIPEHLVSLRIENKRPAGFVTKELQRSAGIEAENGDFEVRLSIHSYQKSLKQSNTIL